MQIGYLSRTPRGRVVTRMAYEHLGIPFTQAQGKNTPSDQTSILFD